MKICTSNVWRITCGHFITPSPVQPSPPLSTASLAYKWPVLHQEFLVVILDPRKGVGLGRNADFPMISSQRMIQDPPRSYPKGTHSPHLPLPHPGIVWGGVVTLHRGVFVTSIGTPVNATADSTARFDTRETSTHDPAAPTPPTGPRTRNTLQTRLWNFSQRTT